MRFFSFIVSLMVVVFYFTDYTLYDMFNYCGVDITITQKEPQEENQEEKLTLELTKEEATEYGLEKYPNVLVDVSKSIEEKIKDKKLFKYTKNVTGKIYFDNDNAYQFTYKRNLGSIFVVGMTFADIEKFDSWKKVEIQNFTIHGD